MQEQGRELEGLEMFYAGLQQALSWMPEDCWSSRSLSVLVPVAEKRLQELESGRLALRLRPAPEPPSAG
jgi:hypothetical protein